MSGLTLSLPLLSGMHYAVTLTLSSHWSKSYTDLLSLWSASSAWGEQLGAQFHMADPGRPSERQGEPS